MEAADPTPPSCSTNQEVSPLWTNLDSKIRTQLNAHTKSMLQASSANVGKLQSSAVELTSIASILLVQRLLDQTVADVVSMNPTKSSLSPSSTHTNTLTIRNLKETILKHSEQFAILKDVVVVEDWTQWTNEEDESQKHASTNQKRAHTSSSASSILTEGLFPTRKKKQKHTTSSAQRTTRQTVSRRNQKRHHPPVNNNDLQQVLRVVEKSVDTKTTSQQPTTSCHRKIIVDEEDYDDDEEELKKNN